MKEEIDEVIERLTVTIDDDACDSSLYNQEESIEIYEGVREHCTGMIRAIRSDMEEQE